MAHFYCARRGVEEEKVGGELADVGAGDSWEDQGVVLEGRGGAAAREEGGVRHGAGGSGWDAGGVMEYECGVC